MRINIRYLATLFAGVCISAALAAPMAGAQTGSTLPQCTGTGGSAALGGSTTECATPGNVQINATPAEPTYLYPWDDEFYGPALHHGWWRRLPRWWRVVAATAAADHNFRGRRRPTMRSKIRYFATLFAMLGLCALVVTPVAAATPDCINTGPNTTQCQTNGSAQIVTSPPANNNYGGWGGWGGGLVIGIGGWGW